MSRIGITGATGLVGSALAALLTEQGHSVVRIFRHEPSVLAVSDVVWAWHKPGTPPPESLEGLDGLVHLAGEPVFGLWTDSKKKAILESREKGTRYLSEGLLSLERPPKVVVAASAIGYYGDRADHVLSEEDPAGSLFLSQVAQAWENATQLLHDAGIRVTTIRLGIVLSSHGGALAVMKLPFSLGLGGPLGQGKQYMSWVALPDVVRAILFILESPTLKGPVNVVSPWPVTNRTFTRALGTVLMRPALMPAPAFAIKVALGQMAEEMLLASTRVEPRRLLEEGFQFQFTELEPSLRKLLKEGL